MISRIWVSDFSIRFEISTSCSRVRRGTCPICLRYIRTGSSMNSSFAERSRFSAFAAEAISAFLRTRSLSSTTSTSICRRRMMIESISSAEITLSGRTSLMRE